MKSNSYDNLPLNSSGVFTPLNEKVHISVGSSKNSPRHLSANYKKGSISVDDLLKSVEGVSDEEYLELLEFSNLRFYTRNDLFMTINFVNTKLLIWGLNKPKRLMLRRLVDVIVRLHKKRSLLLLFLFKEDLTYPLNCRRFMHMLFTYTEELFNEKSFGIVYSPDGVLLSCDKEAHWNSYFNIPLLSPEYFLLQCFVYLNAQEFLEHIYQTHDLFLKTMSKKDPQFPFRKSRLTRLLICWTKIFKEVIPNVYDSLVHSCLFQSDLFDELFIEKFTESLEKMKPVIKSKIGLEKNQQFTMPRRVGIQSLIQIELKDVDKVKELTLYEIHHKIVAAQLMIYDHEALKTVYCSEFYTTKHFRTLQNYINKVRKIESLTVCSVKNTPKRKIFSFFIKVAVDCIEYGDYNVAYMIFSSLNQYCTSKPQGWIEMKRSTKNKWNELEQLFSISGNNKNYKLDFEKHSSPKIPVTALWMGEIIRYSQLPSLYEDGSLNMIKVDKISHIMSMLLTAKETPLVFTPNKEIQQYLSELSQL
ncbi:hypothetical protein ENUP19_0276G0006 [Entamoeba nuttalli]|uniref:Ras guanine nucleotide exchange factor, putative n=2 Tax=Entamoeba nuttalli TaxID=412467 RepID=K2HZ82_ENTNP|nr:Ras guanine nucleotide exchange factor, putative [Entamoeba nuttalli P19]EKE41735.1 Ras guanine nucleotide exchange factor, putative [Entamoeba nuttalli P19]|eukprot:XP_008855930.1 Ras guanine nucleotide exchange factor, putative [Entamoeba nuttalli P19]